MRSQQGPPVFLYNSTCRTAPSDFRDSRLLGSCRGHWRRFWLVDGRVMVVLRGEPRDWLNGPLTSSDPWFQTVSHDHFVIAVRNERTRCQSFFGALAGEKSSILWELNLGRGIWCTSVNLRHNWVPFNFGRGYNGPELRRS